MNLLIFYILLAIGISFICSILEAVVLSISPSHLQSLKTTNPKQFNSLKPLRSNIERPLASILTLNTIAHTIGAAGAGAQAQLLFGNEFITAFSIILTVAILLLSEIIPKSIGARYWKVLLGLSIYILPKMIILTYPFVFISMSLSKLINQNGEEKISREEVNAIAELAFEGGELEEDEYKILLKLMAFKDLKAKDIIIEVSNVKYLSSDMTFVEACEVALKQNYSRLPVYGVNCDDIHGYILRSQLLSILAKDKTIDLDSLTTPILIVPSDAKIKTMFFKLLSRHEHIAAVVDEYGSFIGIVTLEDIIEALLGVSIIDELDDYNQDLKKKTDTPDLR
ncbi:MAG: DUF21 domain-containing protein [Bacteriovoracaceae bacterium]|nr:DUF21 domain-containing protein [Bacteriovoracaceae bacterium]